VDDFDALEAAGIANARERAGLIKYLDSLGFTVEEMVEAEARGRLFGLAGDVLLGSGPPRYSIRTAAEALEVPVDDVAHAWALLGLTVTDLDEIALSQADVDGLSGWFQMKLLMGDDGAFGFLRVLGSAMARLAEAESTFVRAATPDIQMDHTHDELATAQAFRWVGEFIPRISVLVDAVHRQHMVSARTYFEGVLRDTSANVVCGVGFADLSGFTALTQTLSPAELSMLLNEFIAGVSEVIHADGGRVVKFIGDEVMWVSSTPELLAKAAVDLVAKGKEIAAAVTGVAPENISFTDGRFVSRNTNRTFDFLELANEAARHRLPDALKDGLAVVTDNEMHEPVFPNGTAICEVEIDPETGELTITRYTSIDDVGRCINPLIVHGQTHGAIVQGVGQAICEQVYLDPDSGQPLTGSLMDYGMPHADQVPSFRTEIAEVLSPTNPLGIKAGGEGGTTAAPAVVVSAILDALGELGVRDIAMPATPYAIWTAIRKAKAQ